MEPPPPAAEFTGAAEVSPPPGVTSTRSHLEDASRDVLQTQAREIAQAGLPQTRTWYFGTYLESPQHQPGVECSSRSATVRTFAVAAGERLLQSPHYRRSFRAAETSLKG